MVAALVEGVTGRRLAVLQRLFGVSLTTLARWRAWWRGEFPAAAFWLAERSRFVPPPAADELAPLLRRLIASYAATGLPPAYLPFVSDEPPEEPAVHKRFLGLYGLKGNAFSPELPLEAWFRGPRLDDFCRRLEHVLLAEGGCGLISGEPGSGKSVTLRLLAERLETQRVVAVGVLTHLQSHVANFYGELGDAKLLAVAARRELTRLDEKFYFELCGSQKPTRAARRPR